MGNFRQSHSSIGQTYKIVGELDVLSAETYVRMQIKMIKYILPPEKEGC